MNNDNNNNNKYSTKENLAFIIFTYKTMNFETRDSFMEILNELMEKQQKKGEILDKVEKDKLSILTDHWELNEMQVLAYSFLVFNHFKISKEDVTVEKIIDNYKYQLNFSSPDNAVEFVDRKLLLDWR